MLCLTESAPFTTQEISITGKGKICGRLQNFISPQIEVILADFIGRNVLASGLVDGHADRIDVIDVIEELLAAYIEKPQGKPTLVPESDKRPAMNTAKNDKSQEGYHWS